MQKVRYRQNYKYHVYSRTDRGLIPALLRDGEYAFKPFGGFLSFEDDEEYQFVKLVNLTAYTVNEGGLEDWKDIPTGHLVLGCYRYSQYFIFTWKNSPVTFTP